METIITFIKSHPGLKLSFFEKQVSMPKGTLRINRAIKPEFIEPLKKELSLYGYNNSAIILTSKTTNIDKPVIKLTNDIKPIDTVRKEPIKAEVKRPEEATTKQPSIWDE